MVGRTTIGLARSRSSIKEFVPLKEPLFKSAREPLPISVSKRGLFGSKTIGLMGGVMLLINNLAGPTVSLMPSLTQQAGWLTVLLAEVSIGLLTAACGFMTLAAMRAIPGNRDFDLRVEYIDMVRFYFPGWWSVTVMVCYVGYLTMTLMSYIIQTAQVIDYVMRDTLNCAYGLQLWPSVGIVCGTAQSSDTPFDSGTCVFSLAFVIVAIICTPLSLKNLDDNITLQWMANIGLFVLASVWVRFLVQQPLFPKPLPIITSSPWPLISTLFFNFALASALPSWANEKDVDVSVNISFGLSISVVIIIYSLIGIIGGMSFSPYFNTDQDLFSKLNASGSWMLRFTVGLYPVLQNFTSIPVFSILIRYNLIKLSFIGKKCASIIAVGGPWLLSIPFYTGHGFQLISSIGGIIFSIVINNAVPIIVYLRSIRPRNIALAVQRCDSAKISDHFDFNAVSEIGPGLVIAVAFDEGATEEGVRAAAKFVLNARLSGSTGLNGGSIAQHNSRRGAESVLATCKQGKPQGVLVMPQASLLGDRAEEKDEDVLYYPEWAGESGARILYELFVASLCESASEIRESLSSPCGTPSKVKDSVGDFDLGASILRGFWLDPSGHQCERGSLQVWPQDSSKLPLLNVVAADFSGTHALEVKSLAPLMHSFVF